MAEKANPGAGGTAHGAVADVAGSASKPKYSLASPQKLDPWRPQLGPPPGYLRRIHAWFPRTRNAPPDAHPYGMWICSDYYVLFDRNYTPIWTWTCDGVVTRADTNQWHEWRFQIWFYTDADPPWQYKTTRELLAVLLAES